MKIENKLTLAAMLLLSVSCSENKEQKGYIADGEFYVPEREIYLCVEKSYNDIDTISTTKIINNKFKFEGITEIPENAYIVCDDYKKIPLILENGKYSFKIDILDYDKIKAVSSGNESKINDELQIIKEEFDGKIKNTYNLANRGEITYDEASVRSMALRTEYSTKEDNLIIKPNPNSFVAMDLVYSSMNMSDDKFCERFDLLGKEYSNHPSYKDMAEKYKVKKNIQIGKTAPDFKVKKENGEEFSFYDIKSKFKVLYFNDLSTISDDDRDAIFKSIYKKYDRNSLEILELSSDYKKEDWLKDVKTGGKDWLRIYLADGWDNPILTKYNKKGSPYIYLLDADNKFLAIGVTATEINKILNSKL